MIHLFVNGSAASAGGGLTYLRNVIPILSGRADVRTTVALNRKLRDEFVGFPNLSLVELEFPQAAARRFWVEQRLLPGLIRRSGAGVLVSAGNFALRNSPVPQILLSRNSLYTSADFYHDLRKRRDYRLWLDTRAKAFWARRSISWADRTVAPSRSFADELSLWSGREVNAITHGFDAEKFSSHQLPLPNEFAAKLGPSPNKLRLLFVSHYNYYRNFETLLRAIPILQATLKRDLEVVFTCKFQADANPGWYRTGEASQLIRDLKIANHIVELGPVPYYLLHHVYRACDIYVSPAYAESFAHPLVEAMSCGLPLVVSDLPVHREIAGDAALYFQKFSAKDLAGAVEQAADPKRSHLLVAAGPSKAIEYSWRKHVDQLLDLASTLV